jgi:hypothetical protein
MVNVSGLVVISLLVSARPLLRLRPFRVALRMTRHSANVMMNYRSLPPRVGL